MKYEIPEELNSRIDEAEQQMMRGETVPGEEVSARMRAKIIKQARMDAFSKLILAERPVELDDSVVLEECKAARQDIYNMVR